MIPPFFWRMNMLDLQSIKIDGGTQPRAKLDESVVSEYADAIIAGANFPPVVVFHDGKAYWLADGFHRFHAHRKARAIEIAADVRTGTKRDAILYSLSANGEHGLRRSNEDKRGAVKTMLADKEWAQWSDRDIAKQCNVSHPFVAGLRPVTGNVSSEDSAERSYTTKHGTKAAMKTGPIAESNKARAVEDAPRPVQTEPTATTDKPDPLDVAREHAKKQNTTIRQLRKDLAERDAEIESLRGDLAETRANASELADSLSAYMKAEEGDHASAKEIIRLTAKIRVIESTRDQYITQNAEMKRTVASKDRQIAKLEKPQ